MDTCYRFMMMCLTVVVITVGATYCAGDKETAKPISLIRSGKAEDREQGRRIILEERARVIQALIDIIKAPRVKDGDGWLDLTSSRNTAIACIGEYRAPEAVSVLLALMDPAPGESVVDGVLLFCPAGDALVKIGKPSISAIVDLLAETDTKKMSASQARLVIFDIEGAGAGEMVLKNAVAEEKDAVRRANLEAHLNAFRDQFAGY